MWTLSRQPPLTHDTDDILLHNHLIVEAGVVPKEQHDIAEITARSELMYLPQNVDEKALELCFSI